MEFAACITKCLDQEAKDDSRFVHYERIRQGMNLQLIQAGWQITMPGYRYGPMARDHYLIHFIMDGRGRLTDMHREFALEKGWMFLISRGKMAMYEADQKDPWRYFWLGFDGPWSEEILKEAHLDSEHPLAEIPRYDEFLKIYEQIHDGVADPGNYLRLTGLLYQALDLVRLARGCTGKTQPRQQELGTDRVSQSVRNIITLIESSYGECLKVQDIARAMGFSRSYLTEIFHRETGASIMDYITEYRMQRACLMMNNPSVSIKQTAVVCGYHDPLFFSRMFKKRFGLSPSEFRVLQEDEKKKISSINPCTIDINAFTST